MTKIMAKCVDNSNYGGSLTIGKIYEVEDAGKHGDDKFYQVVNDRGEIDEVWQRRFEVVSPVAADQLKAGDRVRVTGNSNMHNRKIGDICYLVELRGHGNGSKSWSTSTTQGGAPDDSCWIRLKDMELAEQPAIIPEPEIPSKWANVEIGYY